jgi:hypothetical protein
MNMEEAFETLEGHMLTEWNAQLASMEAQIVAELKARAEERLVEMVMRYYGVPGPIAKIIAENVIKGGGGYR